MGVLSQKFIQLVSFKSSISSFRQVELTLNSESIFVFRFQTLDHSIIETYLLNTAQCLFQTIKNVIDTFIGANIISKLKSHKQSICVIQPFCLLNYFLFYYHLNDSLNIKC